MHMLSTPRHTLQKCIGVGVPSRRTVARGFTIVELLIVIVVIAILAAISVVAYVNIQRQAVDSTIKSDLSQVSKQFEIFNAKEGRYPRNSTELRSMDVKFSRSPISSRALACYSTTGDGYALYVNYPEGSFTGYVEDGSIKDAPHVYGNAANMCNATPYSQPIWASGFVAGG